MDDGQDKGVETFLNFHLERDKRITELHFIKESLDEIFSYDATDHKERHV